MPLATTKQFGKQKKEKTTSHSVHVTETGVKSILTLQLPSSILIQDKNKVY